MKYGPLTGGGDLSEARWYAPRAVKRRFKKSRLFILPSLREPTELLNVLAKCITHSLPLETMIVFDRLPLEPTTSIASHAKVASVAEVKERTFNSDRVL